MVSRNRKEMLRRCLASLEQSEARNTLQVIVVDNGSTDGSARLDDEFSEVQFIRLPKNFGLTKALNIGWRAADAEYVFFLHDDTELEPGAVIRLAEALDAHPEAAAVCPLLIDAGGNPALQLGELPPTGKWTAAQAPGAEPVEVDYPRGAALMIRIISIKAIRQIDERYGQFGSDADLATQILAANKKILLLPDVKVRHHGQHTETSLERADFLSGRAVFLGKYRGAGAGFQARLSAVLSAFFGFRFGELKYLLGGQKIDGTQA